MSLTRRFAAGSTPIVRALYSKLPFPGVSRPTFIIGCGRSGTTALGTALSKHRDVTYLNEPRDLWAAVIPETDIWTSEANSRSGKLVLTEADVDATRSKQLSRAFRLETILSGRPVLVEKLPINTFRMGLIHQSFPDARFIHIFRNGLEVASSIEKESKKGKWFGANDYKWNQLVSYAKGQADTSDLPALCTTYRDMGLLEWRLSTEAVVAFLSRMSATTFSELNYDQFVDNPVEAVLQLQDFIGVDRDPNVAAFVSRTVTRKSTKLDHGSLAEKDRILGGKLLPLSMDGRRGLIEQRADHGAEKRP